MTSPIPLDALAEQMKAAAEKALAEPKWPFGKALGDHLVASNPANVLAILAERDRLASLLAKAGEALEKADIAICAWSPDPTEPIEEVRAVLAEIKDALSPMAAVHKEGTDAHR